MKKLLHTLLSSFIAAIILIIGPMGHVSAMQMQDMGGMDQSSSVNMPEHCTMLCTPTAAAKKEDSVKKEAPDKDDEPSPLYFQQFDSVHSGYYVEKSTVSRTVDLPSKIPKYRACCVIRR